MTWMRWAVVCAAMLHVSLLPLRYGRQLYEVVVGCDDGFLYAFGEPRRKPR